MAETLHIVAGGKNAETRVFVDGQEIKDVLSYNLNMDENWIEPYQAVDLRILIRDDIKFLESGNRKLKTEEAEAIVRLEMITREISKLASMIDRKTPRKQQPIDPILAAFFCCAGILIRYIVTRIFF